MNIEPGTVGEGFVLAGGKGKRMGRDKAMLIYEGRTLLDRAVAVLRMLDLEVRIIGDARDRSGVEGVPFIPDLCSNLGPLGGIHTALKLSRSSVIFLLACDMPLVTVELLRYLGDARGESEAAVPLDSQGRLHPLCGVYSIDCLPALENQIRRGQLSVGQLLQLESLKKKQVDISRPGFPDRLLFNVNSPEDYAALLNAGFDRGC